METTVNLFKNGRSQAVRLPKAFRFSAYTVKNPQRRGKGILEPMESAQWPPGFWKIFTPDPQFEIPQPLPSRDFSLD